MCLLVCSGTKISSGKFDMIEMSFFCKPSTGCRSCAIGDRQRRRVDVGVVICDDVGDGRRRQFGEDLEIEEDDFVRAVLYRVHQHRKQVVHVEEEAVRRLLVKVEDPSQNRDPRLSVKATRRNVDWLLIIGSIY